MHPCSKSHNRTTTTQSRTDGSASVISFRVLGDSSQRAVRQFKSKQSADLSCYTRRNPAKLAFGIFPPSLRPGRLHARRGFRFLGPLEPSPLLRSRLGGLRSSRGMALLVGVENIQICSVCLQYARRVSSKASCKALQNGKHSFSSIWPLPVAGRTLDTLTPAGLLPA